MSSVYDSSDGLWQYITQHSPPPEREEIAQIIGRSVINRNADLLTELKALKEIVFESSGGRINNQNNWGRSKRTTGRRAISEARQYSQLHYGEESMRETSMFDAIYGITAFTLEDVVSRLDEIRECFEAEKVEISQEIDRLNNTLSGDFGADCDVSLEYERGLPKSMSALSLNNSTGHAALPQDRLERCAVCNARRDSSMMSVDTAASKHGTSSGPAAQGGLICNLCQTTRALREAKIGGSSSGAGRHPAGLSSSSAGSMAHSQSTPGHIFASAEMAMKLDTASTVQDDAHSNRHNNNADSPGDAPRSARSSHSSSRFRSRIDAARHEHHFLEDF